MPLIYNGDEVGAEFDPYDEEPPIEWRDRHGLTVHYTSLTKLRRDIPALRSASLRLVQTDRDDQVLAFVRGDAPSQKVLVVLNFSAEPLRVRFSAEDLRSMSGRRVEESLSGRTLKLSARKPVMKLSPYQAAILQPAAQ